MSNYTEAIDRNLAGIMGFNTGFAASCQTCRDRFQVESDYDPEHPEHIDDEGSFSSASCDSCGTHLAGDRYIAHGFDDRTGTLYHFDFTCRDCVAFHANGEEPESWER